MNQKQYDKILSTIDNNATMLGLGDWEFQVEEDKSISVIATCIYDMWEKEATIKFNPDRFGKNTLKYLEEVTMHELVHMRFGVEVDKFKFELGDLMYRHEEDFINDIIRWKTQ